MSGKKNTTSNKQAIEKVLQNFFTALSKKDIKSMMMCYAPDVIVFDVKPPFQVKGAVAWKHVWEASLPFFPDDFKIEVRDLTIHTDGGCGFAHYLFKLTGPEKDHDAMQTWMRATTGYKFIDGRWKVVHEHGSLPFNPQDGKALFSLTA